MPGTRATVESRSGGGERLVDEVNDAQTRCDEMRLLAHNASVRDENGVVRAVEGGGYGENRGSGEVSTLSGWSMRTRCTYTPRRANWWANVVEIVLRLV